MGEVEGFVCAALEASMYVSPRDHGLTHEELFEAGTRVGLKKGEITESIGRCAAPLYLGDERLRLDRSRAPANFHTLSEPDYRNPKAFDHVYVYFRELAREVTQAEARAPWDVVVATGSRKGLPEHDVDVAIAILLWHGHLEEEDGQIAFASGRASWPLPSEQLRQMGPGLRRSAQPKPHLTRAHAIVSDIIARRTDGRPPSAEPLEAFKGALKELGHARFLGWWSMTLAELQRCRAATEPLTICVLSAALAEGALALVVQVGQERGTMRKLDASPRNWKFNALISAARTGNPPIFDDALGRDALRLNELRQRIHAGALLEAYPSGPLPDLRPEEAEQSLAAAKRIVRTILDWLESTRSKACP